VRNFWLFLDLALNPGINAEGPIWDATLRPLDVLQIIAVG